MRKFFHGTASPDSDSRESLELQVSDPGEFANLADFASRTILACSLVGYSAVEQAAPRTLAEFDRAAWVADSLRLFAGIELPPPTACQLYALVELADRLELAIEAGPVFVALFWDRESRTPKG